MRKHMLAIFACASLLGLAGCGGTAAIGTPPDPAASAGLIKADYPIIRAAAETYAASPTANPGTVKTINAAIAQADPLVAAVTATPSVANDAIILQDMSAMILTPAGQSSGISPNTKADIGNAVSLAITAAQAAATLAPLF